MDDEDIEMDVTISKADFVGTCARCGEPSTGSYDLDEADTCMMRCVSCSFKSQLKVEGNLSFLVCGGDNG